MQKIIVTIFAIFLSLSSFSQYHWDVGVSAGFANYLGEFGGGAKERQDFILDMNMAQTSWNFGGFGRRKLSEKFSIAAHVSYLELHGADSLSSNPGRVGRNLSFRNRILEVTVRPEFYFITIHDVGGTGRYQADFRAYGFLGLTTFWHNPQAEHEGTYYDLQPMNTEQINQPYGLTQVAFPLGVGFYFTIKKKHRIGWDLSWRITFTDYLDDASTVYADPASFKGNSTAVALSNRRPELGDRDGVPDEVYYGINPYTEETNKRGDPSHNDHYLTTSFSYSYVLRGRNSFFRSRYNYVYGGRKRRRKTRAKF